MKVWEAFNIVPNDEQIYKTAFTHKSYLNENKDCKKDYERMEWVGDAILQVEVSKYIFNKDPKLTEGEMTLLRKNAVETKTLAKFSKDLGLQQFLLIGNSEDIIREKLHADIFESFIGALFQDNQLEVVQIIFKSTVFKTIDQTLKNPLLLKNAKTRFQEEIKLDTSQVIKYEVTNEIEKTHDFIFEVQVMVDDIIMGKGSGKTKRAAEAAAAEDALSKLIK